LKWSRRERSGIVEVLTPGDVLDLFDLFDLIRALGGAAQRVFVQGGVARS
jgi:hypothetical protein